MIASRNGTSGRINFSIGSPLIDMPTKRHRPTGGVIWPTAEAITHTIPKCIGWMPAATARPAAAPAR